jgi:hypothetical protein
MTKREIPAASKEAQQVRLPLALSPRLGSMHGDGETSGEIGRLIGTSRRIQVSVRIDL